jgi:hypothetical protein
MAANQVTAMSATEIIPSYDESLIEGAELCRRIRAETAAVLHLDNI